MPILNKIELKDLTNLIKEGNKAAFEQLYDLYSGSLYGIILKIIRDEEMSQDVLQDSFVKIWKKIKSFDDSKGTLFTWMLNIARNTAIDKLRKLKREGEVEIQTPDWSVDIQSVNHSSTNVNTIGLKDFVDGLLPEQKIIIDYLYFKGYTQQEVADELNLPLGTVKTRARAAVIELKKIFLQFVFWI